MSRAKSGLGAILGIGLLAVSAVGVAAQEVPVEVTGEVVLSGPGHTVETWTTNDPRLSGTGTWAPKGSPRDPAPDYWLNGRFLENEEGVWRQLPIPVVNIPGYGNPRRRADDPHFDMVLIGEGGYEGLVFIAQATWTSPGFDVRGYIVEAEAP